MSKSHGISETNCILWSFTVLAVFAVLLTAPIYIDQFSRSTQTLNGKVSSIYNREFSHGKQRWFKYKCGVLENGIEIEVPDDVIVGDNIQYTKNSGKLGIVPSIYKFLKKSGL